MCSYCFMPRRKKEYNKIGFAGRITRWRSWHDKIHKLFYPAATYGSDPASVANPVILIFIPYYENYAAAAAQNSLSLFFNLF